MRSGSMNKIGQEMEKISNPKGSYEDNRMWKPEVDKMGNATAVIRFLPATIKTIDGEEVYDDVPWVRMFSHGFQGPTGRWFIDNCATTIGEKCVVCENNNVLWSKGDDKSKEIARQRKRKTKYYANVLIVSDPKNPENEGQVKLFAFGAKIFDKIMDKMNPTFEDEQPVNVFDYWEGADFKLRQRKVEGYPNYDQSVFLDPSPVGSDDYIIKVAEKQYLLKDLVAPKEFKSYEEIKKKYNEVMNAVARDENGDLEFDTVSKSSSSTRTVIDRESAPVRITNDSPKVQDTPSVESNDSEEEEDETLAYFRKIAMED